MTHRYVILLFNTEIINAAPLVIGFIEQKDRDTEFDRIQSVLKDGRFEYLGNKYNRMDKLFLETSFTL